MQIPYSWTLSEEANKREKIAHATIAALFSVSLILGTNGANFSLQPPQQEASASSQAQGVPNSNNALI